MRQFNRLKGQSVLPLQVTLQNPVEFLEDQLEKKEKVMKDKILEKFEAIAKAEGVCPIEDVMHRGIDTLAKELNPIELSRFVAELRRMKSGVLETSEKIIKSETKTVRELLTNRYTLDYYQREYNWQKGQVEELLDDLTNKFLENYKENHDL